MKPSKLTAYAVHAFTASGAAIGTLALYTIYTKDFHTTFLLMAANLIVDGIDGTLARKFKIKESGVKIDGELLDNIIDFLTWTVVPSFILLTTNLLPEALKIPIIIAITMSSAYQFSQTDAKTSDHFFKGFPDYWNLLVFYLFLTGTSPLTNAILCILCVILTFVPIKYIYNSRPEFVTKSKLGQKIVFYSAAVWFIGVFYLLFTFPTPNPLILWSTIIYGAIYVLISIYRTLRPLK